MENCQVLTYTPVLRVWYTTVRSISLLSHYDPRRTYGKSRLFYVESTDPVVLAGGAFPDVRLRQNQYTTPRDFLCVL